MKTMNILEGKYKTGSPGTGTQYSQNDIYCGVGRFFIIEVVLSGMAIRNPPVFS